MKPSNLMNSCAWLLITTSCIVEVGASASEDRALIPSRAGDLVQQLGDDQFVRRELAMERLIKMGTPAITAVEEGVRSIDREVRYRSLRVLLILRRVERIRLISDFLQRQPTIDEDALPAWKRLSNLLGDDDPTRALYARMMQRQWELLNRLDQEEWEKTSRLLAVRVDQLKASPAGHATRKTTIDEGTFATLLLVALEDNLYVADQTVSKLWSLCRDISVLQRRGTGDPDATPLRRLLGISVRQRGDTFLGLSIAMKYGLTDGLVPAQRVLEDPTAQHHSKQYAILTVAKFGGPQHIPLLTMQLDDQSILSNQRIAGSDQKMVTQVRDVALAALWLLVKEDPTARGFTRFRPNAQIVFYPNSTGFQDPSQRQSAFDTWREFSTDRSQ